MGDDLIKNEEVVDLTKGWIEPLNAISDPILILDTQHTIIQINKAMLERLGQPEGMIIGKKCYALIHHTERPPDYCPFVKLLKDGEPHVATTCVASLNGCFQVSVSPIKDPDGTVVGSIHVCHEITLLKQMEAKLRESREDLIDFLDSASDLILIFRPDGTIIYVNKAWKEVMGYSDEDLAKLKFADLIAPGCRDRCLELFAQVLQGHELHNIETTWLTKDGKEVVLEGSCNCKFKDGEPVAIRGIFRNISERKKIERALRNSEERLRTLINATPDMICFKDHQGRWMEANIALIRLFDLHLVDYRGKTDLELAKQSPAHRDAFVALYESEQRAWHQRAITREELCVRVAGGMTKVFDIVNVPLFRDDGSRRGLVLLGRDITMLKETEEALKHLSYEQTTILENVPVAIAFVKDRRVQRVNKRFLEVFKCQEKDVLGKNTRMFYPSAEDYRLIGKKAYTILAQGETFNTETQLLALTGELFWCQMTGKAISPPDLSKGTIWILEDITQIKESEAQRERLRQDMLHAQKLESLGILAGGIAHDFNNLLMGILGYADLALLDLAPNSPVANHIRQIQRSAQRAGELTNQMLAYSGKGKFLVEAVDLSSLVREMGSLLKTVISKKISLEYRLDSHIPSIEADVTQLRQVVMNLITNAAEAIGDAQGSITISTGAIWLDEQQVADAYLKEEFIPGEYVLLQVEDTGCGMDEATKSRIFDPFFTTKFSGRGLGLAAVMGIVRGHKGIIKIHSKPGHGTVFKIMFPPIHVSKAVAGKGARFKATGVKEHQGHYLRSLGKGRRILVVDDEETVRQVTRILLEEMGFKVILAHDGKMALELLQEDMDIDLVILDMTMPKMDGKQTLKRIRAMQPNLKVLLSSGYAESYAKESFGEREFSGFIQKPYEIKELAAKIKEVLKEG